MNPVDPGAGEAGQRGEVRLAGQPARLEPPHLAGRGGPAIQSAAIDHRAHRRIMRQAFGVVHILMAGEAPEHGLPQQPCEEMAGVPATATLRQRAAGQIGQPERVVQFPVCQGVQHLARLPWVVECREMVEQGRAGHRETSSR